MTCLIEIISGIVVGLAGFHQISENPTQALLALFLAGFLLIGGFEKLLLREPCN